MTPPPPPPSSFSLPRRGGGDGGRRRHLLIGTTGSVATIKLPLLVSTLTSRHSPDALSIYLLPTSSSRHFLSSADVVEMCASPLVAGVWTDEDEWRGSGGGSGYERGAEVLHIELRRWADALLVAPLSANSLAKICAGMCGNLLLSVVRAWDGGEKGEGEEEEEEEEEGGAGATSGAGRGIMVAPAMNTRMWRHPVTAGQIKTLEEWGIEVLGPVEKTLACGDVGIGGMESVEEIVKAIERRLGLD